MSDRVDALVIGGGAMGTAAARSLAERGRSVRLLERFEIGHARGSSGGPTRIFRLAYHHPEYVRLARLALAEWRELEDRAAERLMITTAGLDVGAAGQETAEALEEAGEAITYLSSEEVAERWPALHLPRGSEVFVQEEGGVVMAARTLAAQVRLARAAGADLREHVTVERLTAHDAGIEAIAGEAVHRADVAVVTAGPWAGPLLRMAGLDLPLVPSFEQVTYFALEQPSPLPTVIDWTVDPPRTPYVVPDPERAGRFKVALHRSGPSVDADRRSFEPDPDRVARATAYAAERFAPHRDDGGTETCLYTNTPDEDFVLDRRGPLVIGSPCSGHGFKFAPLIGRILADLVTGDPPPAPLDRFRADRAALRVTVP
jgi:sarcosine oxidase